MDWFPIALAVFRIALAAVLIVYSFLFAAGRGENPSVRRAGLMVAMIGTVSAVFDLVVFGSGPSSGQDDVIQSVLTAATWVGIVWFFILVRKQQDRQQNQQRDQPR